MILHPSSFYLWHWQSFGETFYWFYQFIKHGIYYCFLAGPSEQDLDGEDERSEGNPWRAVCSALVFSCTILWLFLIHILCIEGLIYRLILSMSFLCVWDSQIFLRIIAMQIIASTHLRWFDISTSKDRYSQLEGMLTCSCLVINIQYQPIQYSRPSDEQPIRIWLWLHTYCTSIIIIGNSQ